MATHSSNQSGPGPINTAQHIQSETGGARAASRLISGRTVQGTRVYSPVGADCHPIPFGRLTYDIELDGYRTDLTKEQLEGAPRHNDGRESDRNWQRQSHDRYGVRPYWM